jgi:hypothetical protein
LEAIISLSLIVLFFEIICLKKANKVTKKTGNDQVAKNLFWGNRFLVNFQKEE